MQKYKILIVKVLFFYNFLTTCISYFFCLFCFIADDKRFKVKFETNLLERINIQKGKKRFTKIGALS